MNASTPTVSMRVASASSDARRAQPLVVVFDPGGRPDEDQPIDELRMGECGVQRDSSAHRVADIGRSTAVVHEVVGARPQVGL